ncbi:MAG: hypothetical protein JST82_00990 [Bacteroidetes bacterium]|nr:hypothetical protein [Bacteroidota bacterium]
MRALSFLLLLCLSVVACKKSHDTKEYNDIDYYDADGNALGKSYDGAERNYQPENWDKWQYQLFKATDSMSRDTIATGKLTEAKLYPNPVKDEQYLMFSNTVPALFRAVLIDKKKQKYWHYEQNVKAGQHYIHLNYDSLHISAGFYRMYYSLSSIGYSHYYRAHADVQVR